MRYTYKLVTEYLGVVVSPEELIRYLEILGLNPSIIDKSQDDIIFELETPANRGDLSSLIGVARELSPFVNVSVKTPPTLFKETSDRIVPVKIEDNKDCPYYSCRVMEGISMGNNDFSLKEQMEKLEYRTGFNVIDISNYVMAETGQPLHIFDLDKIEGDVEVRRARKGESLITIDGKKQKLDDSVLVIADSRKVIAIAGIMGGQNSEVTLKTKNILIESAIFSSMVVRRGSKKIGLDTEASARFKRGVSLDACKTGIARALLLIQEICGGEIGPISEAGNGKEVPLPSVKFNMTKINKLSGSEIKETFVLDLLTRLNFKIEKKNDSFFVIPPSYRKDIKEEVDIIEEVLKYKQYESVPTNIPFASIKATPSSLEVDALEKIRDICIQLGFTETVHMGLTTKENVSFNKDAVPVEIENPISLNLKVLRTDMMPEMLDTIKYNIYHSARSFNLFEIGKTYYKEKGLFKEEVRIAFASVNSGDFFALKGKLEKMFDKLRLKKPQFKKQPGIFSLENNLAIYVDNKRIGDVFILSDEIKDKFDLKKTDVYGIEMNLERIIEKACFTTAFKEPFKHPSARRDFSFIFHKDIDWGEIEETLLSLNLPVEKIEFFDSYKMGDIPKDFISVAFSVFFRSDKGTLANEDVTAFSDTIIKTIGLKLKGQLRGTSGET